MSIRLFSLLTCTALLAAAAPPQTGAGLPGEWRNTNNTVHLRVQPCGKALCGTVTWASDSQRAEARKGSGKELVGSLLMRDLTSQGGGTWRGKVFVPAVNTTASATILQVNDKLIRVSGCTFLGVICKTQHWHRIQ